MNTVHAFCLWVFHLTWWWQLSALIRKIRWASPHNATQRTKHIAWTKKRILTCKNFRHTSAVSIAIIQSNKNHHESLKVKEVRLSWLTALISTKHRDGCCLFTPFKTLNVFIHWQRQHLDVCHPGANTQEFNVIYDLKLKKLTNLTLSLTKIGQK